MKEDDRKKKGKKPSKKPYAVPILVSAGNLLSMMNSPWASATSLCCLTERMSLSRRNARARRQLLADVAAGVPR